MFRNHSGAVSALCQLHNMLHHRHFRSGDGFFTAIGSKCCQPAWQEVFICQHNKASKELRTYLKIIVLNGDTPGFQDLGTHLYNLGSQQ